jgi:nitrogen regulatory protein P-II 1
MMKLIIAYIQPDRLNAVKQELFKDDIHKISVTNALGCGQQMGYTETYRGVDVEVNLLKKVRIEIAVTAPFIEKTVNAIIRGARSGEIGDGKIFILPIEDTIRIRSGERGEAAIG